MCVNTFNQGPVIVLPLFGHSFFGDVLICFVHKNQTGDSTPTGDYCPSVDKVPGLNTYTHIHHTVHMALVGYLIVFCFVTKCGQTIEFLLWGTIVPLNFLVRYHCSIVASNPQPMAYAFTYTHTYLCCLPDVEILLFLCKNTFFKPLPFALKILFRADFVSVLPLNNLLHFVTDNDII